MYEEGHVDRSSIINSNIKNIEQMKKILQFIEVNYQKPITQAEVARQFFFTQQSFSRFFKQNTGITFTEHLFRYRIQQARKDLVESNVSISEIAYKNGFSDERNFINAFKKVYKITPLQYRKKMWKE